MSGSVGEDLGQPLRSASSTPTGTTGQVSPIRSGSAVPVRRARRRIHVLRRQSLVAMQSFLGLTLIAWGLAASPAAASVLASKIVISDVALAEGTGEGGATTAFTFTLELTEQPAAPLTVPYETSAYTATAGTDFTPVEGSFQFMPDGPTSTEVTVQVFADSIPERNEEFSLISGGGDLECQDCTGVAVIHNDDPQPNDDFADAQVIPGGPCSGTATAATCIGSTIVATGEPGEPGAVTTPAGHSIWYRWTAPTGGTLTVDTFESDFATDLGVFTGSSVSDLTRVASNDNYGGTHQSRVDLTARIGTTYSIMVDADSPGYVGTVTLHLSFVRTTCPGHESLQVNQMKGTGGIDTILGTPGVDVICGLGGNDQLEGLGGNDILLGGDGVDVLLGGLGNDVLDLGPGDDSSSTAFGTKGAGGGPGNDRILGGTGNDDMFGWAGNDALIGGAGNDVLFGDAGTDSLIAGAGNDVMAGFGGTDVNNGGPGFDCADFEFDAGPVVGSLSTGKATGPGLGSDTMPQTECIFGTAKADTLTGNGGGNTLWGLKGNDRLYGLAGNDYLHGWEGYDTLDCGTGTDLGIVGVGGGSRSSCEYTHLARESLAPDTGPQPLLLGRLPWGMVSGSGR
jgi:hypothetical protein